MSNQNLYPSDKELVARYLAGEQDAFHLLFNKYWNDLYKIAYRRLPSEEDVKDLLQEVFISLWKNLPTISISDNLGGYLYTSLQNKIFNFFGKKQVRLRSLMNQPFVPVQSETDSYHHLQTKELRLVIKSTIDGMPLKMKEIYLLSKEENLSNGEIASLLMLAPQTVKNQIYQALCRIRNKLEKSHLYLLVLVQLF
jgi:RNA polymerase sigma-70 factor (ECF subfamily)